MDEPTEDQAPTTTGGEERTSYQGDEASEGQMRPNGDHQTDEQAAVGTADRVVISYPADLSEWGRYQVEKPSFRAWLRRSLGPVAIGDSWEAFVGVGCCGSSLEVPLRIETVDGGRRVGEETTISYEVRDACGIEGGWQVQSQAGPNEF